ncbi:MAG: TM2 domain-containing protein [Bacteroidota bacterium]
MQFISLIFALNRLLNPLLIFGLGIQELLVIAIIIIPVVAVIYLSKNNQIHTPISNVPNNQAQQVPYQGYQQTIVSYGNQKSVLVAFLLAFFFGPLGLLYSSVAGGLVLIIIGIPIGIITLGVGLIFIWIASIIWAIVATNATNAKMQSGGGLNIITNQGIPPVNQQPIYQPPPKVNQQPIQQPIPVVNQPVYTQQPYQQYPPVQNITYQQTVVSFGNKKSMLVAFLLAFFFGPLGLLYSSVTGGIVLMIIGIPIGIFTLGFGLIFIWIASVIWAIIAINNTNDKLQSTSGLNVLTRQGTAPTYQQPSYQPAPEVIRQPIQQPTPEVYQEPIKHSFPPVYHQPISQPTLEENQQSNYQEPPNVYQERGPRPSQFINQQHRPIERIGLPDYYNFPSKNRSRYSQKSKGNGSIKILKPVIIGMAIIVLILILLVGVKYINIPFFSNLNLNPLKFLTKDSNSSVITENPNGDFYIVNVEAVKSQKTAEIKVESLKSNGFSAGYLWIPDYPSLSGIESFAVYIGPFATQYDCEVATEDYRKINPDAYGLLVSKDKRRVEIYGIGSVNEIPNWKENKQVIITKPVENNDKKLYENSRIQLPKAQITEVRNDEIVADNTDLLRKLDGSPWKKDVFDNPKIKKRLKKILGKERYAFMDGHWNLGTDVKITNDMFVTTGCMSHFCPQTNFIIVIDLNKDIYYVGIRDNDHVRIYSEKTIMSSQIDKRIKFWIDNGSSSD